MTTRRFLTVDGLTSLPWPAIVPCLAIVPLDQSAQWTWTVVIIGAALFALVAFFTTVPAFRRFVHTLFAIIWQRRVIVAIALLSTALGVEMWREWRQTPVAPDVARPNVRPVAGSWPMDRGNLTRTGCTPNAVGPTEANIRWRHGQPGESFYASAAIVDDYVYVVGNRDERARVYCLDRATGELHWSGGPVDYAPTFSSPIVLASRLFCGEGLHATRSGRLVALDLAPERAGALLWEVTTHGHVECTPHATSDAVYFNAGDDGSYAVRLDAKPRATPRVSFHLPGRSYTDAETCLAVHDGRLYIGLGVGDGGAALCLLDAATGQERRRATMPYPVFTPPSFSEQLLLIGMGEGDYATPTRAPVGAVYALDPQTLDVRWKRELTGTVLGAIAIEQGEAFLGCANGRVYAIRLSDQQERSWDSGAPITTALAVTPHTVFGVNARGRLFALDRQRLLPRWEMQLGGGGRYVSAPVVAGERLYVGTELDGFFCIGAP